MTILDNPPAPPGPDGSAPLAPTGSTASSDEDRMPVQTITAARVPSATDPESSPSAARRAWRKDFERSDRPTVRTAEEHGRAQARMFCWAWLLFAMAGSVGGNVQHAWMTAPDTLKIGAAILAIFPPLLLLGATHLMALLISTRRSEYRIVDLVVLVAVMLGTVGVAVFAFTISFYALRDLMLVYGQPAGVAWRWPIAIDLSLIVSSLAMLSLTEARITQTAESGDAWPAAAHLTVSGPTRPAERRLWWESIAAVVRDDLADIRKVADLTPKRLGEILERMYDHNASGRGIKEYTGLHHREVKAIKEAADGVLARTTPSPVPIED